jgi:hypothetical protein
VGDGVQLGTLHTTVTNGPVLPAPGDYDDGEKLGEWLLVGETEVLGQNLSQYRFVHQKPHMYCPDAKPGRRGGNTATNLLSYRTA